MAASAGSVSALGLYQEPAPWYDPTFADTTLAFGTGASATTGTSRAALFHLGLAPIQRRSFRFAVTWSYVFLRSTETPAWLSTWLRESAEVSCATSTSRMRELAAEILSRMVWILVVVTSKRFMKEPNLERELEMLAIAESMVASAPVSYTHLTLPTNREV